MEDGDICKSVPHNSRQRLVYVLLYKMQNKMNTGGLRPICTTNSTEDVYVCMYVRTTQMVT